LVAHRRHRWTPTSIGRPRLCVGTRREVAVKASNGTGELNAGSNSPHPGAGPPRADGRTGGRADGRTARWSRSLAGVAQATARGVDQGFHSERLPTRKAPDKEGGEAKFRGGSHGSRRQAMVLSCELASRQRHAEIRKGWRQATIEAAALGSGRPPARRGAHRSEARGHGTTTLGDGAHLFRTQHVDKGVDGGLSAHELGTVSGVGNA
jgi:hypothetical protein